jgi:hypothetical protein
MLARAADGKLWDRHSLAREKAFRGPICRMFCSIPTIT